MRYLAEALLLRLAWAMLGALPLDTASNATGKLARWLGPRTRASHRARQNLRLAMPELDQAAREAIVRKMWENLGRTFAEYPHLGKIMAESDARLSFEGLEHFHRLRDSGKAGFLVSGHFANWEVMHLIAATIFGDVETMVREPNNPYVRRILEEQRGVVGGRRIPKGREGARAMLAAIRRGAKIPILLDQKASDGEELRFFGKPAMTATAIAETAVRRHVPVLLVRFERLGPGSFKMTILPPMKPPRGDDRLRAARDHMQAVNDQLEAWIRDKPEDWLWLHRRWPKPLYDELAKNGS